jgi:tRNA pseudouridine55 synthase
MRCSRPLPVRPALPSRSAADAEAVRLMHGQALGLVEFMGRIPADANPDGGLVRAMAGGRFVGLCRLDSGQVVPERLVAQEGSAAGG